MINDVPNAVHLKYGSMGREEQIEEREVLDSIFPDEITDIDEKSYRIAIKPEIPQDDNNGDVEPRTVSLSNTAKPTY